MEVSKDTENSQNPSAKIHVNTQSSTDKTEQHKDSADTFSLTNTDRSQQETVEGDPTNLKWNPSATGEDIKRAERMQSNGDASQQYYENGELYDPSFYYYNGVDAQDAHSLHYGGRGRGYSRGRGFSGRPQSWKKSTIPIVNWTSLPISAVPENILQQ